MTAATATVVAGGGTHVAFMAALLDLASRDELAFVAEDRPDQVGIAFRGGETADPRVLLNRRNPIGEAETWLLGELKASLAIAARRGSNDDDAPPSPEMVAAGMQMFGSLLRMSAAADDGFEARAAREHGLDGLAMPDAASIERAYEARTGHPMSDKARAGIEHVTSGMSVASAMSNPAAVAADPERFASMLEQMRDEPTTPEEHRRLVSQLHDWAAKATSAPPTPRRILAGDARHLQAPFLFGTLLQTYAKRHGWIGGLSVIATVKWTLLAALELVGRHRPRGRREPQRRGAPAIPRRRNRRRRRGDLSHRRPDARAVAGGRRDEGAARGLPAHARGDLRRGELARGHRRHPAPAVARDARPGDRLGDGARPAARVETLMVRTSEAVATWRHARDRLRAGLVLRGLAGAGRERRGSQRAPR